MILFLKAKDDRQLSLFDAVVQVKGTVRFWGVDAPEPMAKAVFETLSKAEQRTLFDALVHVGPAVRDGKAVKPYTRKQRVARPEPHPDLFPKPKLMEGKPAYAYRHVIHGTPITPAKLLDQMAGESFCVSFADPRNIEKIIELQNPNGMLLLDNGAFSHWKQGKGQIDRQKFFDWANDIQHHCAVAVAVIPDVIEGNEQQNWQEAAYAVHELSDFPERLAFCWHMNDSIEQLKRAATLFNVVAIGSCAEYDVQKNRPAYLRRLQEASMMLDYVEQTRGRRPWVHLMRGVAVLPQAIRFESADSTNVARNHTYTKGQPDHVKTMVARINKKVHDAADEAPLGVAYPTTNFSKSILFFKASSIPEGARWITVHPNGPDEKGQPLLIQPGSDGSAHVIGGAGGSLNYLKLKHVRSESEYKASVAAKREQQKAAKKEQAQADKEAGIFESKKEAKAKVRGQRVNQEAKFIQTVADSMGWDKDSLTFPEGEYRNLSEGAVKKLREKFHRSVLKKAKEAVAAVRKQVLTDADARLTADLGMVPVTSTADDVVSVQDLDPIPTGAAGLGFTPKYEERAEAEGLSADERSAAKDERQKTLSDGQRAAIIKRGELSTAINAELKNVRDPTPILNANKAELTKAAPLFKAEKMLRKVTHKAREAMSEIDAADVEPKAYIIEADEEPDDASVEEDLSNDLRAIKTHAFLSEFKKLGDNDSLGKYIGIGAYNSVNALSLAVSGDALVDRSVVDVLGIAGAAQVLARRLHSDLTAAQSQRVAEGMQQFHLNDYLAKSQKAMDRVKELTEQAKSMEMHDMSTAEGVKTATELNRRHAEVIKEAQTTIGEALGEMEANAALTLALKKPSDRPFQVSMGDASFDTVLTQARAIGLQRGDYQIETVAGNTFLTVTPAGMDRLAKPVNAADIQQVQRNLAIIGGHEDEDGWLPGGFARRPDLVAPIPPGVAPRLAEPFQPSADLRGSLESYIGGRAADGDNPADIMADIQSADFIRKAGDPAAYQAALDAVAPLHAEDGKILRAEDMAPAFERYADAFVQKRYGSERTTLNRQQFKMDDKAADALHRALAETPEGVSAYKPIGELDAADQRALRGFFQKEIAKESPEAAGLRAELESRVAQEPEKEVEDMFGDRTENPEWSSWNARNDSIKAQLAGGELTWDKYLMAMHTPEKAYEAIQDLIRSRVNEGFAKTYNTLNADAPIKTGRASIRHNLNHLDMVDPAARAKRQEADRARIDALRERNAGKYASGAVSDKLDAARAQEEAFNQSQMGFFSSEEEPPTAERPLAADERHTLGHVAERQIAGMMGVYGRHFDPKRPTKIFYPSMSGGKNGQNFARQRIIKMMEANKRAVAAFGTGSGKTAIQLGSFTHLKSQGKARRGLFLVPSVVQGEFASHALQLLEPGKFNWHVKPGAGRDERIAAYKDPQHNFAVMTHSAFRDDMLHLGAKAAGITEREMAAKLQGMSPGDRKAWMGELMKREGIDFDFLSVDEGQQTLNRQGKQNSSLANVVDALSEHTPYYMSASADTVKNDTSEIFDIFKKMDPERYKDRDAFMRRYGADTIASKDALRREMARYIYPSKIDPDVKIDRRVSNTSLSDGQKLSMAELDKHLAAIKTANREGRVDMAAVRAVSPGSFAGVPEAEHERIAKDLQKNAGLMRSAAIHRIISTHPDNPGADDVVKTAEDRKGKPGIVFAHSLEAVKLLTDRLEKAGHKVVTVTGADSAAEKDRKRRQFMSGEANILVASDAASTGMNAQRGQWVYQYDTPQTAMTHAQREGRIKRVGQKNDIELIDNVPDHPEVAKARDRLKKKYGLRELMTTPMETLDDTGVCYYLKQKQVYKDANETT